MFARVGHHRPTTCGSRGGVIFDRNVTTSLGDEFTHEVLASSSQTPWSTCLTYQGCETGDVSVRRPCPGERCGRVIRELGLPKVLSETACRGDDRQTFRYRDGWNYRTCRSARVVPSAAAGFCDQSSSANAAVAGPSLRARVSASCWRSEGWMDCRLVAFFSPGDITELRPIEPSLARVRVEKSGSLQVQGSRRRASAAARSSPPCSRPARRLVRSQTRCNTVQLELQRCSLLACPVLVGGSPRRIGGCRIWCRWVC